MSLLLVSLTCIHCVSNACPSSPQLEEGKKLKALVTAKALERLAIEGLSNDDALKPGGKYYKQERSAC